MSGDLFSLDGGYLPAPDLKPAEEALIGAIISSQRGAEAAADLDLKPEHFHFPAHQIVYEAVQRLWGNGEPVSPVTVMTELTRTQQIGLVGGAPHVHTLMAAGEMWSLASNAERVKADHARRALHIAAVQIAQMCGPGFNPAETGDLARKLVDTALAESDGSSDPARSADLYVDALTRLEHPEDVAGMIVPPYSDLQAMIRVLRPGQLVTVGARPGTGKSTVAADLLRHVGLRLRLPVVLFSLEMGREEIMDRVLSAETSVPLTAIQGAALTDREWDKIAHASTVFSEGAFEIDDSSDITVARVRSRLRRMARRNPARLVIIDYLQLMKSGGKHESREREIADITGSLKRLAREFEVPIVLLAQLNRGPEQRTDRRPVKSDLRESGAIENDSDIVILIHRPDMGDPESARVGEADFIVDKNRTGPLGWCTVVFQGHFGRFVDMAREWSPSAGARDAA